MVAHSRCGAVGLGRARRASASKSGRSAVAPLYGGSAPTRRLRKSTVRACVVGEHHRRAAGDPALDRRLLPPAGVQAVEDPRVDHPAVHVLAAGERPRARAAAPGARRGRARVAAHEPAGPAPTTIASNVVAGSSPTATCPDSRRAARRARRWRRTTTARSAICIIGQCGSVFTLTTWAGAPSPAVCCTAPLIPKARYSVGIDRPRRSCRSGARGRPSRGR